MKIINLIISLSLLTSITSCSNELKVSLYHCVDGECTIQAKFKDQDSCEKYGITWFSYINYEELVRTNQTLVRYEKKIDDGSIVCKK